MANPLTGDFQAVVQVSGRTVNRLLATLHQNVYQNLSGGTKLPTIPSTIQTRIGDSGFYGAAGGVRGKVRVQVGVPALELIDGATHEVWVTAPIRARCEADPGTAAFPEFIYGRVRAKYRMFTIPVTGIRKVWFVLLQLAVDPASISFTSFGDRSADPQITEQVRLVMVYRMAVSPHPLVEDFQADHFRSLVGPSGEAAVCHPLAWGSGPPAGDIATIQTLFLAGRDFAVAVSRDYVLSQLQPSLDALKSHQPSFSVTRWGLTVTYTVTIHTATAKWSVLTSPPAGFDPVGVVTLTIAGDATTSSILPNASFSVTHDLWVLFGSVTETLSVVSGAAPSVSAHVNGPFGGLVRARVANEVTKAYNALLTTVLTQATAKLQAASTQKQKLVNQLQTLDAAGEAHLDASESLVEGFILRGHIDLSKRHAMSVQIDKLPDDSGYTALASWIPGGYVVNYQWRWYFTTAPISAGTLADGTDSYDDRFVLQSAAPLPGMPIYDGSGNPPKVPWGQICLLMKGRVVDPVTGLEHGVDNVPGVFRERQCLYVVPPPPGFLPPRSWLDRPRYWWSLWAAEAGAGQGNADERIAAYVEAAPGAVPAFNVLLHYLHDEAALASLPAVAAGVRAAARADAGLLVVVVLREGLLRRGGPEMTAALRAFAERLDTLPMVTEDVQAGWSTELGLSEPRQGASTILVDAKGAKVWRHEGPAAGETIAAALREHLRPCAAPRATLVQPSVRIGELAPRAYVEVSPAQWVEIGALRGRSVVLSFAQAWARPCIAQLRRLQRSQDRLDSAGAMVVAVVDGAGRAEARALAQEHGLTFAVSSDPGGAIARQFGIRVWPTTVTLDEQGRIADVEMGADGGALAALAREQGAGARRAS